MEGINRLTVPKVELLLAIALALIQADTVWGDHWLAQWSRLFGTEAEGARQMLSTLAGSMMSVMGITFSMTLVALTPGLASCWYSPGRVAHAGPYPSLRRRVSRAGGDIGLADRLQPGRAAWHAGVPAVRRLDTGTSMSGMAKDHPLHFAQ